MKKTAVRVFSVFLLLAFVAGTNGLLVFIHHCTKGHETEMSLFLPDEDPCTTKTETCCEDEIEHNCCGENVSCELETPDAHHDSRGIRHAKCCYNTTLYLKVSNQYIAHDQSRLVQNTLIEIDIPDGFGLADQAITKKETTTKDPPGQELPPALIFLSHHSLLI